MGRVIAAITTLVDGTSWDRRTGQSTA